jgi:hypothetical protein
MRAVNELELTLAAAYTHGTDTYLEVAEDLSAMLAAGEIEEEGIVRVFDNSEWVLLRYESLDTDYDQLGTLSLATARSESDSAYAHEFAIGAKVWGVAAADYVNDIIDSIPSVSWGPYEWVYDSEEDTLDLEYTAP